MNGLGCSTVSSNSSVNSVTVRSDMNRETEFDPIEKQYRIINGDRLTIKSISIDSAPIMPSDGASANIVVEPIMPANEILFRKYFTFYDLLSSINMHRLFLDNACSNLSGQPSSSLLDLNHRGTTSTTNSNSNVGTFESSTLSSTSSYSSCTSSMSSSSNNNNNNNNYHSFYVKNSFPFPIPNNSFDVGNELLAPSQNFLNE